MTRGSNLAFLHPFCYKVGDENTFDTRAFACPPNDHTDNIIERIGPLNETFSTAAQRPAISQAERDRRQREVDFARGSVAYEGGVLTEETERLSARYVAGEISGNDMTAAILERYATRP